MTTASLTSTFPFPSNVAVYSLRAKDAGCRSRSTSQSPDRIVPRFPGRCHFRRRRPPAPFHSAARSPCVICVQWPCCRSPSTLRSPDRIVQRLLSSSRVPPATSTCLFRSNVAVWQFAWGGHAAGDPPPTWRLRWQRWHRLTQLRCGVISRGRAAHGRRRPKRCQSRKEQSRLTRVDCGRLIEKCILFS